MRHTLLMHPLPRTGEIATELDRDPRSVYFRQAAYGVPVRMALVSFVLEARAVHAAAHQVRSESEALPAGPHCANPNCITRREETLAERRFRLRREPSGGAYLICSYCDQEGRIQVIGNRKSRHFHVYEEPMYGFLDAWLRDGALVVFDSVKEAEEAGYKPYKLGPQKLIMNAAEMERSLEELADGILAGTPELKDLVLIGIKTPGAYLAHRIAARIRAKRGAEVELGVVDVHRGAAGIQRWPAPGVTEAPPIEVENRLVVVIDDVINTGWTAKEALAVIWRAGRPCAARMAVLIDRGHRELPIKPTYVGKHLPTAPHERVRVRLREMDRDHKDTVVIYSHVDPKAAA